MKKLYGVITAMTTPFDAEGEVELDALARQVDFLVEKGVNCLYPCGTTGEMYLMTEAQRMAVAQTVVKQAAGRATVFIHTGAMDPQSVVRLSRHAYEIGADGVGIVTPSYFIVNRRAMVAYYRDICAQLPADFSVYVYVIPQLSGNDVPGDMMEEIAAACPNVVGVKYSYADMTRVYEYLAVRKGTFSVVYGPDNQFLPALAAGCDGTVSGCSCCIPEPYVAVYDAFLRGDIPAAQAAQRKAGEITRILGFGTDMSAFKNVQTLRGVPGGHTHKPLLDMEEAQAQALLKAIKPYIPA